MGELQPIPSTLSGSSWKSAALSVCMLRIWPNPLVNSGKFSGSYMSYHRSSNII